ncbi:MAG: lysophospholipid acyltransferase family protein [Candidatus Gallimonas sp.]
MEENATPKDCQSPEGCETDKKALKQQKKARKKAEKAAARQAKATQPCRLFPANRKGDHVMRSMNVLRFLFYPVHRLVYPFRLHGNKKIGQGACIYVGNHYCLWDIFYPAHTTKEGIHFMAKQSILEAPVVGKWARACGVIGAMRDGSDVRTLMDSMKVLKNGEKLSMFPEGTRNKQSDETFLPFHGGAALLAIKTKTPVVPFVICNRPKPFRTTHVVFGEPMELEEYYGRKLTQEEYAEADEKLCRRLYELREKFNAERAAKKKRKKAKGEDGACR